jgi:protease IV
MAKFSDYLKNIFWLLIILQLAPTLVRTIKLQYEPYLEAKSKVGVISIKGTITDSTNHIHDIRKFFENEEIKAIVLKIESPGGAPGASQALFNEIKELKKNVSPKFVLALVQNIACSGGYYIACAADYIIATPSAFVGSIGAYIAHPYVKEFIESHKLKYEFIKSGTYKTVGSPFTDLSADQKSYLQGITDNTYYQFLQDVKNQRAKAKLSHDHKLWADGKLFTGEQALKLGLIDQLGSQSNAIQVLKEHAPITGKIEWVKPEHKMGLLQALFASPDVQEPESALETACKTMCQVIETRYCTPHIR